MFCFKVSKYESLEKFWIKEKDSIKPYKLVPFYNIITLWKERSENHPILTKLYEETNPIFNKLLEESWGQVGAALRSSFLDNISLEISKSILEKLKTVEFNDPAKYNSFMLTTLLVRCSRNRGLRELAE